MTPTIDSQTETPNTFPQVLHTRKHVFRADVGESAGSTDSAPGPHDYFDAALAACKALTATVYARKHNIPLESVEIQIARDDSQERAGKYLIKLHCEFRGAQLTDEHRQHIAAAIARCPIHKLMTTSEVVIELE